jgi:putative transposase
VLAVDLGIKNTATTFDTGNAARIYKGGAILATKYYFGKKIAKLQSQLPPNKRGSKAISRLHRKESAQVKHALHCYANNIRDYCVAQGIAEVAVGDLKGVRKKGDGTPKNWGGAGNLQLHSWGYAEFTGLLRYKLEEAGIALALVSEKYTSRTCPRCGDRKRKNRFVRGWYRCSNCGYANHSDVIGATNILKRYLEGDLSPTSNSAVSCGTVAKWDSSRSACTEAPAF